MISLSIGGCDIDIIPIVKGLVSEKEKVRKALSEKDYEAAAVSWGLDEIEAVSRRDEIEGETETNELDSVYSYKLKEFGPIDMPDPAFTYLVDEFSSRNPVIPLDMTDEEFSEVYCENVSTMDFLRENKIVKKALKRNFDAATPEEFVLQWDAMINEIKGYCKMSQIKERYIAGQLIDIAKYKKSLIALIEYERMDGVMKILEAADDLS